MLKFTALEPKNILAFLPANSLLTAFRPLFRQQIKTPFKIAPAINVMTGNQASDEISKNVIET